MSKVKTHAELLRSRQPGYTMPSELFSRQDVFENDVDVFFHKHWILVGVSADVPEPGDVCTVDIGKSSVIIVRDEDNEIRTFRNVCRHRGARIKEAGKATIGKLVCPYHQWTYELNGDLLHAAQMGKDFDHKCKGLKSVHTKVVGGLVFICLANEAPADIATLEETMLPRLAPYQLENTKIAYEAEIIENGNWKLVMENNRECYHCAGTHPELTTTFLAEDFGYCEEELDEAGQQSLASYRKKNADYKASWEKDGLICDPVEKLTPDVATLFRTQRLVMAGHGESQTPDTKVACTKLLGNATRKDQGDTHLWTHSGWNHVMSDHAVVSYLIPLSPDKTLVRTKWLVNADAVEGVDYDVNNLISVWTATNAQDAALVAINHSGTQDPGYEPGPYSKFSEQYVEGFANWYTGRLEAHNI